MKVVILQTGGTIDKDYPRTAKSYAFEIARSAAKRILQNINPNFDYRVVTVLKKDSLDITDKDRQKIYEACLKIKENKIIVTHGTDTMVKTAVKLSSIKNKLIILTGALKPERLKDSDATFNLGTAVGALNILKKGTYIAMSGRIYPWNKCKKNLKTGQFIEI